MTPKKAVELTGTVTPLANTPGCDLTLGENTLLESITALAEGYAEQYRYTGGFEGKSL